MPTQEYDEHGNIVPAAALATEYDEYGKAVGPMSPPTGEQPHATMEPSTLSKVWASAKRAPAAFVAPLHAATIDPEGAIKSMWAAGEPLRKQGEAEQEASPNVMDRLVGAWHRAEGGVPGAFMGLPAIKGAIEDPTTLPETAAGFAGAGMLPRGMGEIKPSFGPEGAIHGEIGKMMAPEMSKALDLDNGRLRVVKGMVRPLISIWGDKVMGPNGVYEKNLQAATHEDILNLKGQGIDVDNGHGVINSADAAERAEKVKSSMKLGDLPAVDDLISRARAETGMSLAAAKNFTTDIGKLMIALKSSGKLRDVKVARELFDGMHEATQARADALGKGAQWQKSLAVSKDYYTMMSGDGQDVTGLMGDLLHSHYRTAIDKLIDPNNAGELDEIKQRLNKFGIDSTTLDKALELGQTLQKASAAQRNSFMGKIRAIAEHPLTAGPAAAGAAMAGRASGIPGMSFIFPLLVAGKVAKIVDEHDIAGILRDLQEQYPEEAQRGPTPVGPDEEPGAAVKAQKMSAIQRGKTGAANAWNYTWHGKASGSPMDLGETPRGMNDPTLLDKLRSLRGKK